MKKNVWISSIIVSVFCFFLVGCNQPASSDLIRRARLVGDENLQLKKQVEEKDKQIANLNKQMNQSKSDLKEQVEKLSQEKSEINKQYAALQKTHETAVSELRANLDQCLKEKEAVPPAYPELEEKYSKLYGDLLQLLVESQTELEKYQKAQ